MGSNQRGNESEARFVLEAFQRGWEVCKPFSHSEPYDFLVRRERGRHWETVQVKTAFPVKSRMQVKLLRGRSGYRIGDFDLLFVVAGRDCYLIPWSAVQHIRCNFSVETLPGYRLMTAARSTN